MKIIIAGSRNFIISVSAIDQAVTESGFHVDEVVSGHGGSVGLAGEDWALYKKLPLRLFPADWEKYGRKAGPLRNSEMADYADGLIVFWDGKSHGTRDMIRKMKVLGKPVYVAHH